MSPEAATPASDGVLGDKCLPPCAGEAWGRGVGGIATLDLTQRHLPHKAETATGAPVSEQRWATASWWWSSVGSFMGSPGSRGCERSSATLAGT